MEELLNLLSETIDDVIIECETPGISMIQSFHITGVEQYMDGVKYYTQNEGEIFISRMACKALQKTEDSESISYVIQTALGAILTITIAR